MKTKKCYLCGNEYDSNLLKCPKCGASNTFHTIKLLSLSVLVIAILSVTTYTLVKVNKLSDNVEYINTKLGIDQSVKLEEQPYYQNYLATSDNFDAMIHNVDTYILYFYQNRCIDCEKTNAYIDAYINMGYSNFVPFIFVSPDAKDIYNRYKVTNTPTAIYVNGDSQEVREGLNEIYQTLDGIIARSISQE